MSQRRVIERYYAELFNEGRIELVDELLHPDYVNHSPGWPELPRGPEGVGMVVKAMRAAFPDLHYTIEDIIEADGVIAVRTRGTGTQRGEFLGRPASGKAFDVQQIAIERFEAGKIVAHYRVTDELGMQQQLGILDR